jgi:hypothetical protein
MTIVTRHSRPAQPCNRTLDEKFGPVVLRQIYGPEHASTILDRVLPKLPQAWIPSSGVQQ